MTPREAEITRELKALRKQRRKDSPRRLKHKPVQPSGAGQRKPRKRERPYLAYIGKLPCIATLVRTGQEVFGVERAHVRFSRAGVATNPGMQRKPDDRNTVPLSPAEHRRQHSGKEEAYWLELGVDPYALIADLNAAYPDTEAAVAVLREHVRRTGR